MLVGVLKFICLLFHECLKKVDYNMKQKIKRKCVRYYFYKWRHWLCSFKRYKQRVSKR